MKSDFVGRLVYDKPQFYSHEVLANLEEIAANTNNTRQYNTKAVDSILTSISGTSKNIVQAIEENTQTQLLSSKIQAEEARNGFSQLSYNLMDIEFGLSNLQESNKAEFRALSHNIDYAIQEAADQTQSEIQEQGDQITSEIREQSYGIRQEIRDLSWEVSSHLRTIDFSIMNMSDRLSKKLDSVQDLLKETNSVLSDISNKADITNGHLSHIASLITKKRETEAKELVDHSHANLHMKDYDKALELSHQAIDVSNASSIIILASHIIILSTFKDKYKQEMLDYYNKLINLIDYRLARTASITNLTQREEYEQEIIDIFFILHYHLGEVLDEAFINSCQRLYVVLTAKMIKFSQLLKEGLFSHYTLVSRPNPLREIFFSAAFYFAIKPEQREVLLTDYEKYTGSISDDIGLTNLVLYIKALLQSKVIIRNELLFAACQLLYEKGLLDILLMDFLVKDCKGETQYSQNVINLFISFQPQENYEVKEHTCFLLSKYLEVINNGK